MILLIGRGMQKQWKPHKKSQESQSRTHFFKSQPWLPCWVLNMAVTLEMQFHFPVKPRGGMHFPSSSMRKSRLRENKELALWHQLMSWAIWLEFCSVYSESVHLSSSWFHPFHMSRPDWHTSSLTMLILSWPGCLCWNGRSAVRICPPHAFVSSILFILLVITTSFLELISGMYHWLLNPNFRFLISSLIPGFYFWYFPELFSLSVPWYPHMSHTKLLLSSPWPILPLLIHISIYGCTILV